MLLGARLECIDGGTTLAEKMTALSRLGYDFLELPLSQSEIVGMDTQTLETYQRATEESGLPILSTSLGHFGGFASLDPNRQDEICEHIDTLLSFTYEIGGDTVLLATTETNADVASYAPVYREKLAGVAERAANAGLTLALEHVGWYKPTTLLELVQAIDHPAFGIYFDMGNCLYVGESPLEQAERCASSVAQLHIKGGPTTPLGAMPLQAVREILERSGFTGRGCLEIPNGRDDHPLAEARGLLKMAGYTR